MTPEAGRHRTVILILVCLAQFMVVLDVAIVNVALPAIRADLHFSATGLQWIVNAYALAFAGFLLLGGRAADILGRREVFAFGMALFGLASLAGGLADSQGLLVAARAAQGLGGAVVAPATLSILSTTFTEGAERNRALGLWGAMGGVGGAAGALVGGLLTQELSWRWILLVNVPFAIAAAVAGLRYVARGTRDLQARRSFDLAGALTVTAGLVALTYGIVETDQHGWGSLRTLVTLGLGAGLLGTFLLIEARLAEAPLVPLRIFRSRQLSGANVVVLCLGAATFSMWYFLSLYFQGVLGYTPLGTGAAFLPMTIALIILARVASRQTSRIGPGWVLTVGMALLAAGLAWLTQVPSDGRLVADLLVPTILCGSGTGIAFVSVTIAATTGVAGREAGLASGLVNTSRQVGGSIGLALLATLATQHTNDVLGTLDPGAALTAGYHRAFAGGAVIAGIGVLASLLLIVRGRRAVAVVGDG